MNRIKIIKRNESAEQIAPPKTNRAISSSGATRNEVAGIVKNWIAEWRAATETEKHRQQNQRQQIQTDFFARQLSEKSAKR